jgi:hypothetical protein
MVKPIFFQLPPAIDFDAYRTPANKSEYLAGKLHVDERISKEDYVELGKYAASFNTTKK